MQKERVILYVLQFFAKLSHPQPNLKYNKPKIKEIYGFGKNILKLAL